MGQYEDYRLHYERRMAQRKTENRRGRRMLTRLIAALLLLALVWGGIHLCPIRSQALQKRLAAVLTGNTDFRATFAALGMAVEQGQPVSTVLGRFASLQPGAGARSRMICGTLPEKEPPTRKKKCRQTLAGPLQR